MALVDVGSSPETAARGFSGSSAETNTSVTLGPIQKLQREMSGLKSTIEQKINQVVKMNDLEQIHEALEQLPDKPTEMVGNVHVVNLSKAKSLLRKELFDWIETDFLSKKIGIQIIHVAFTKCGRFAVLIGVSKVAKSFGLRLATLDPHHRLSTYLLGVSFTLESALLQSAVRIKQIEDDMDQVDRTFQHGDVVMVDHLGYSHCAIYDAESQVFYELVGDIDSGKDAFLSQVNDLGKATTEIHQKLSNFTKNAVYSILSIIKSKKSILENEKNREPIMKLNGDDHQNQSKTKRMLAFSSNEIFNKSDHFDAQMLNDRTASTIDYDNRQGEGFLRPSRAHRRSGSIDVTSRKPVFELDYQSGSSSTHRLKSFLASSGQSLRLEDYDASPRSTSKPGSPDVNYDISTHINNTSTKLRKLAESNGDIGLYELMREDKDLEFASAGSDDRILADDMCPAMAIGFASHSIAEVQATPKDIFLTRDPLLKLRVKYHANASSPQETIRRAKAAIGSPGWNPVTRNCEHFTTWAKTGKSMSTQVFEFSSGAAILGASSLQTFITLAFIIMLTLWAVELVVGPNSLVETIESVLTWLLKAGFLLSSLVFGFGIFIHWLNGRNADFDAWIEEQQHKQIAK